MADGPLHPTRERSKPLQLSPTAQRQKTGEEALSELKLKKVWTSGHHFNCLAFAVMMSAGQLDTSPSAQRHAHPQSDVERRLTHEAIFSRVPVRKRKDRGTIADNKWHAGHNRDSLQDILDNNRFMTEAHIHGFANRLQRSIIVIDERGHQLSIFEYKPGYSVQSQLSMRESKKRRAGSGRGAGEAQPKRQKADATPLWVLMSPGHFSSLQPVALEGCEAQAWCEGL